MEPQTHQKLRIKALRHKKLDVYKLQAHEDWLELEVPDLEPTWYGNQLQFENGISRVKAQQYSSGEVRHFHEVGLFVQSFCPNI